MRFFGNIYLTRLFFMLFGGVVLAFVAGSYYPFMQAVAEISLLALIGLTCIDGILVFLPKTPLSITRQVDSRLNLGDEAKVVLTIRNNTLQPLQFTLYEGYPVELQRRNSSFKHLLLPKQKTQDSYQFTPKQRGDVEFRDVFCVIRSTFHLVGRRYEVNLKQTISVFPSVLQMKKFELLVFNHQKIAQGIKRIRRLGNNSEFEQIKPFVQGDEIKKINWKATSRSNELMVNQYQDEKSQSVYCIVDKSRSMQMEADGLSFLDYSINSALVLSNIAVRNGDKTGLITFSDKMGSIVPAEKRAGQMTRILESLYAQRTHFLEPNYELLYQTIRRKVSTRSLLVLFTNFETEFAMRRALPVLRKLNQKHVLVVVLFRNSALEVMAYQEGQSVNEIYQSIVSEQMISSKTKISAELTRNGIQNILTLPENLSVNTINKYLELKARGSL